MKKVLKVLHIASFIGNIGDNANHLGFQNLRQKFLDFKFEITTLEIRELFWGKWSFNSNYFIEIANNHDLIVIGGGNFFELWVEKSETGTTIDISISTLEKIKTPFVFYALGLDIGQGYSENTHKKFKVFLDYLIEKPNQYFVSLRNDGAFKNLRLLYGDIYDKCLVKLPDAGFFAESRNLIQAEIGNKSYVVINIAGDMIEKRFLKFENGIDGFIDTFSGFVDWMITAFKMDVIFVPHIYRDLEIIYKILNKMTDSSRRRHTTVSAYVTGDNGFEYIHNIYKHATLVLANRFHSNIFGISLGIDTIGLVNYPQIENLFDELESNHFCSIYEAVGIDDLKKMVELALINTGEISLDFSRSMEVVKQQSEIGYQKLNNFIANIYGG